MKKRLLSFLLICSLTHTSLLASTTSWSGDCPNDNPYHILINKTHSLSPYYIPSNLVIPNVTFESPGNIQKNYMEATAAKALEEMFRAAKMQGIRLVAVSGYRSYSRQSVLYKNAIAKYGIYQMSSAAPGHSEHQTGLAMDLNNVSSAFQYTKESKWLAENAHLYGYIIRYPKNKTNITGFIYEPWHIRYVGKELATYCYDNNLTLEELTSCCVRYEPIEMMIQSDFVSEYTTETPSEITPYALMRSNGITYIKARDLMSLINGHITLDHKGLTLTIPNYTLSLIADSNEATLNEEAVTLTYTPFILNNTYYIPLRAVLTLFEYQLNFIDNATLRIHL